MAKQRDRTIDYTDLAPLWMVDADRLSAADDALDEEWAARWRVGMGLGEAPKGPERLMAVLSILASDDFDGVRFKLTNRLFGTSASAMRNVFKRKFSTDGRKEGGMKSLRSSGISWRQRRG